MKHTKLHILIILLLASLLAAKCDCGNNPKPGKKKDEKKKINLHKQEEFIKKAVMKKFGFNEIAKKLESAKKDPNREPGKNPEKTKATNNNNLGSNPVPQKTEQEKQQELAQLLQEEKRLEDAAKASFKQLDNTPLQPLLEELAKHFGEDIFLSGLSASLAKEVNKVIADCKENPELADMVVEAIEEVQNAMNNFMNALQKIQQEDVTGSSQQSPLRKLLDAFLESIDLESAGISMDEVNEFLGSGFFNLEKVQEIEQMLNKPLDPNKLPDQLRPVYEQMVQKHPSAAKSGLNAVCAVLEETISSVNGVIDAQLAILKNIQKQH